MAKMRRFRFSAALVAGSAALWIGTGVASASLNAPLEQCQTVTTPANLKSLGLCGSTQDPLARGTARIGNDGSLEVVVTKAAANTSYQVVFVSPIGGSVPLGTTPLTTDKNGNGRLTVQGGGSITALSFGNAGAGNVVLTGGSSGGSGWQFVTGIAVQGNPPPPPAGPDFTSDLVKCSAVNQPATISNCGNNSLTSGRVDIEGDDGDFEIHVHGASAHVMYTVFLRAVNGTALPALGTFGTDKKGNGQLQVTGALTPGTMASFTVVVQSGGSDQFYSGFNVTQKPRPQTISQAGLVPCLSVTNPLLANCGTDPLNSGSANLDANGKLHVKLTGAEQNVTYTVVYRPLNNTGDQSLPLTVSTDANGNASGLATVFPNPVVGSGSFVLQRGGLDEFVPGFSAQ